jgi:hypothetical protein
MSPSKGIILQRAPSPVLAAPSPTTAPAPFAGANGMAALANQPTPTHSRAASPAPSISAAPAARSVTPTQAQAPSPVFTPQPMPPDVPRFAQQPVAQPTKHKSASSTPELAPATKAPFNVPAMAGAIAHGPVQNVQMRSESKGLEAKQSEKEKKKDKEPNWPPWSSVKTKYVRIRFFTSATPPAQPEAAQRMWQNPVPETSGGKGPARMHPSYQPPYHVAPHQAPYSQPYVQSDLAPAAPDDDDEGPCHTTEHLYSFYKVNELVEVYAKNEEDGIGDWWNGIIRRIRIFNGNLAKIRIEYEAEDRGYNSGQFANIQIERSENAEVKWYTPAIRQAKHAAQSLVPPPVQPPQQPQAHAHAYPQLAYSAPGYGAASPAPGLGAASPAPGLGAASPAPGYGAAPVYGAMPQAAAQDNKTTRKKPASGGASKSAQKLAIPSTSDRTDTLGRPPPLPAGAPLNLVSALQQGMEAHAPKALADKANVQIKKEKDQDKSKVGEQVRVKQEKPEKSADKAKPAEKSGEKAKGADKSSEKNKSAGKESEKTKQHVESRHMQVQPAPVAEPLDAPLRSASPLLHCDMAPAQEAAAASCSAELGLPLEVSNSVTNGDDGQPGAPAQSAWQHSPVVHASMRNPPYVNPVFDWPDYAFTQIEEPGGKFKLRFKKVFPYPPAKRVKFVLNPPPGRPGAPESWVGSLERRSKGTPSGESASYHQTPLSPTLSGGAEVGPPMLTGKPNTSQYAPAAHKGGSPGSLDFGGSRPLMMTRQEHDVEHKIQSEGRGAFRMFEPSLDNRKEVSSECVCACIRTWFQVGVHESVR